LWLLGAGLLAPGSADGFTTHGSIARYYLLPLLKKIGHCCILYTLPLSSLWTSCPVLPLRPIHLLVLVQAMEEDRRSLCPACDLHLHC